MRNFLPKLFRVSAFQIPLVVFLLINAVQLQAQIAGTKTIPGDYSSITEAIQDIKIVGLAGHTILELGQSYNQNLEPALPVVFPENLGTTSNATLTIRPAASVTGLVAISANIGGPVFKVFASYVNFDGRSGGVGNSRNLVIINNSPLGSAIHLIDNASNNSIVNCQLESAFRMADITVEETYGGVVAFTSPGPFPSGAFGFGPQNNTIQNCRISGRATFGVCAIQNENTRNGTAQCAGNKIIGNDFAMIATEFGGPHGTFIGDRDIVIYTGTNWTISDNNFFHEVDVINSHFIGIALSTKIGLGGTPRDVLPSGNNHIERNFIGGSAPGAAGSLVARDLDAIILQDDGPSFVTDNVIKNIKLTDSKRVLMTGIHLSQNVRCTGNQIGSSVASEAINITSAGNVFSGIQHDFCGPTDITQNKIQNIVMNSTIESTFIGIGANASPDINVSNNLIEMLNIQSIGTVTLTVLDLRFFAVCPVSQHPFLFNKNLFKNILAVSEDGDANFTGVHVTGGIVLNDGNIIGSATEANSILVSGKTAVAKGLVISDLAEDVSISNDVIANITATGVDLTSLSGIEFTGRGVVKISNNQIHHLNSPNAKGIYILPLNGPSTTTLEKNIIAGVSTSTGTGVEARAVSEVSLNFVAKENTVSGWQTGFLVASSPGGSFQQTFESNSITGNQTGMNNQTGASQNATCNWWGSPSGPSGAGPGTGNPVGPNIIFSPWATIPNYVAVNAGADKTIYIGFGDQKVKLTPTVTVCGTPQYLWSNGATTPTITVSPTATTNYTVTVNDANGHQASDQVTVIVKDIRCGVFDLRVKVCHTGLFGRKETLCVFPIVAAVHLLHGDVLGDCSSVANNKAAPNQLGIERVRPELNVQGIQITAYPNPTSHSFTLNLKSSNAEEKISMKVFDLYGRLIEARSNVNPGTTVQFGSSYKSGTYILQVVQGKESKQMRLVKIE